jgi:hypothetical protein
VNKLFLLLLASIITSGAWAQDSTYLSSPAARRDKKTDKRDRNNRMLRMEEEGDLIFNKHNIFGIKLSTDGYGISFEKGKYKTPRKTTIFQFELNEKKSPKEKRLSSGDLFGSSIVAYKTNNFYQFKVGMGQEYLIGGKGNKNGVAVSALYAGGLSLGIIKPYYVNAYNSNDLNGPVYRKTFDQILTDTIQYDVSGASGFTVGWGHVSVKPGLHAKIAMRFDYGRFNQTIGAIEAGLSSEFYFGKISQVLLVPERQFFFNGYVTILFGSRK